MKKWFAFYDIGHPDYGLEEFKNKEEVTEYVTELCKGRNYDCLEKITVIEGKKTKIDVIKTINKIQIRDTD